MRTLVAVVFGGLLLASCGGGGSNFAPSVSVPTAPADYRARIDATINGEISGGLVPSVTVGVARHGKIVYAKAYGSRAVNPSIPADVTTVYQIASLTKAFTAAAVLLLAQNGTLSLDDALSRFVPEYPPASKMTLRQMLNMVSGIPANVDDSFDTLYGPIDHESAVRKLSGFPLDFDPGSRYEYANANYYLLGLVIERAAGMSYADFVTSKLIRPLGLSRTAYLANWGDPDTARGYSHVGSAEGPFVAHDPWSADYLFAFGGLVSDATDLLMWDESLRSPGILTASSLATMFAVPNRAISSYAMGWVADPDGTRWHDGESGGFNSAQAIFPDGYDVVVLGNTWDRYSGAFDPIATLQTIRAELPP